MWMANVLAAMGSITSVASVWPALPTLLGMESTVCAKAVMPLSGASVNPTRPFPMARAAARADTSQ